MSFARFLPGPQSTVNFDWVDAGVSSSRIELCSYSLFCTENHNSCSGAEVIRTPDLRRAKAVRYIAGDIWTLRNSCK